MNLQMAIASQNTTVDVTADSTPVLETATATISGTVTDNEIQHLPTAGRDVFQLTQLAPVSSATTHKPQADRRIQTAGPGAATRANGIF